MNTRALKSGVACLLCCFLLIGCREKASSRTGNPSPPDTTSQSSGLQQSSHLQRITINGVPLFIETAQSDDERQRGLMFRESLPADQGMLFVFPISQIQSFWMRNTFIPLDIAFIDEAGTIVDIQQMKPVDESVLYTSKAPALYALEVNAGWFAEHGIKVGDSVRF